jgi:hypothetical protein
MALVLRNPYTAWSARLIVGVSLIGGLLLEVFPARGSDGFWDRMSLGLVVSMVVWVGGVFGLQPHISLHDCTIEVRQPFKTIRFSSNIVESVKSERFGRLLIIVRTDSVDKVGDRKSYRRAGRRIVPFAFSGSWLSLLFNAPSARAAEAQLNMFLAQAQADNSSRSSKSFSARPYYGAPFLVVPVLLFVAESFVLGLIQR